MSFIRKTILAALGLSEPIITHGQLLDERAKARKEGHDEGFREGMLEGLGKGRQEVLTEFLEQMQKEREGMTYVAQEPVDNSRPPPDFPVPPEPPHVSTYGQGQVVGGPVDPQRSTYSQSVSACQPFNPAQAQPHGAQAAVNMAAETYSPAMNGHSDRLPPQPMDWVYGDRGQAFAKQRMDEQRMRIALSICGWVVENALRRVMGTGHLSVPEVKEHNRKTIVQMWFPEVKQGKYDTELYVDYGLTGFEKNGESKADIELTITLTRYETHDGGEDQPSLTPWDAVRQMCYHFKVSEYGINLGDSAGEDHSENLLFLERLRWDLERIADLVQRHLVDPHAMMVFTPLTTNVFEKIEVYEDNYVAFDDPKRVEKRAVAKDGARAHHMNSVIQQDAGKEGIKNTF